MTTLHGSRVGIDAELMDAYLLGDGQMDVEQMVAPPEAPPLVLVPPSIPWPTFDELMQRLEAEEQEQEHQQTQQQQQQQEQQTRPNAEPARSEPQHDGQVVTVFSPKGGTGTTFVATTLALLLADRGARRVCIVDLDLQFGDLAISTGLSPNRSIADAVPLADGDDLVGALVTPWQDGVDCVLAPVDPAAAEEITPDLVRAIIAALRDSYDFVVVDTPSQLSEHVLEVLDTADRQVFVTTPEIASVKSTRILLDTLKLLGHDAARRSIVLNRSDSAHCLDRAEVAAAIVNPLAVALPTSPDVAAAVDSGVALCIRRPEHVIVVALRRFVAQTLVGELVTAQRRRPGLRLRKRSA